MKKLLILGQVPKEHGGNYTTGVANVIMELAVQLAKDYQIYIYGTNLKSGRNKPLDNIKFFGYSKIDIALGIIRTVLLSPVGFFKELRNYRTNYGLPPIRFMANRIMIGKAVREVNPDIINAHGMIFAPILSVLGLNHSTLFSFHGIMHDDPASILANKNRGIDMQKLYTQGGKLIDKAIYLTPAMKNKGTEILKIPDSNTAIISNGVDLDKFRFSVSDRLRLRNQFNLNENDTVFISVGALTGRKNHIGFIEYLKRNRVKCHYWIIGKAIGQEKETRQKIDAYVQDSGDVRVHRVEYVPHNELYAYYSAADVYAHPSSSEGQALVVLEALCSGLPLIVNDQIRDTIGLDRSFEQYIEYVNLVKSGRPRILKPNRKMLSEMCRRELSWHAAAEKYNQYFSQQ